TSRVSKYVRRNLKRSNDNESRATKKVASLKPKTLKKRTNDDLLVLEVDSQKVNPSNQAVDSETQGVDHKSSGDSVEERPEPRSSEIERCESSHDEASCDVEDRSVTESPEGA